MLSSTTLKLSDPNEYQAAMGRATDLKTVVTAPGTYQSETMLVNLQQIQLAQVRIALPQTVNGTEVPESYITLGGPGAEFVTSTSVNYRWGGMILTPEILSATSQALIGQEIAPPNVTQQVIRPPD